MIIGISGKMQSGKDTAARLIQEIIEQSKYPDETLRQQVVNWVTAECLKAYDTEVLFANVNRFMSDYEVVRFADKLYQCVSAITGIPVHLLPSQEVKDQVFIEDKGIEITIRTLLQKFGTDVGRVIHPDIWITATMRTYKGNEKRLVLMNQAEINRFGGFNRGLFTHAGMERRHPNWIMPDVRFENECEVIEAYDGFTIRINRPLWRRFPDVSLEVVGEANIALADDELLALFKVKKPYLYERLMAESEVALDEFPFKHIIDNTGHINTLKYQLTNILTMEGII